MLYAFFWSGYRHYFTAFKYLLIACRTTSPRETCFLLAATFSAFICFRSIRAINLVSFMVQPYPRYLYMSMSNFILSHNLDMYRFIRSMHNMGTPKNTGRLAHLKDVRRVLAGGGGVRFDWLTCSPC